MSRSLNKVMLIGHLGSDPEVRTTTNGTKVATLSIATARQWTSTNGEKQEKTEWHRCVAWDGKKGGLASVCEQYVKKGDRIYVEGQIEYREYEKDGVKKYTTEINVRELVMLGGKPSAKPESGGNADDGYDEELGF